MSDAKLSIYSVKLYESHGTALFDVVPTRFDESEFVEGAHETFTNPLNDINGRALAALLNKIYRQGLRDGRAQTQPKTTTTT